LISRTRDWTPKLNSPLSWIAGPFKDVEKDSKGKKKKRKELV